MNNIWKSIIVAFGLGAVCTSGVLASDTLYKAVQDQDAKAVQSELDAGADPNYFKKGAFTALGMTAYKGNAEIAKLLIDAGADVDQPVRPGSEDRPLSMAAVTSRDATELITLLVARGADTEFESGDWVMTPLQLAIMNHRTDHALALIEVDVDLIAPDKVGDPALHGAIYQRNEQVVRSLLEHGVDPTFLNDDGLNAVQFAKKWDRAEFALPLLDEYHPDFCASNPCDIE